MGLTDTYTSTGAKFFAHQEAMTKLRNGKGQPIVTHVMLTDVCNHTCAFCSVQHRAGDSLSFDTVVAYLNILKRYGLKAVILSGGGNPILYRCKHTGATFNDMVKQIHSMGLEIGLITNGLPSLKMYVCEEDGVTTLRESWSTVDPSTLDMLTWLRVSMSGLDHVEDDVFIPDINPKKTTLGFSYVAHDIYNAPEDKAHGKVSTTNDLLDLGVALSTVGARGMLRFEDRMTKLVQQIGDLVFAYRPKYVRLLPNCLEPHLIPKRVRQLQVMADTINPNVVFVQNKPPKAPKACYLGYVHPVLNCDGYVYPCDSCVLNENAEHSFAKPWRICHWTDIDKLYDAPVRSLIADPARLCPGCVFHQSNEILGNVVGGIADTTPPQDTPEHVNFV